MRAQVVRERPREGVEDSYAGTLAVDVRIGLDDTDDPVADSHALARSTAQLRTGAADVPRGGGRVSTVTRSPGIPITSGGVCYGFAGAGYSGATAALDALVEHAASALVSAYKRHVTIRFNSDRESGGAFLVTHAVDGVGANSEVGICASVVTERTRSRWGREAERWTREGDHEWAALMRERLATEPAGTLQVYAHLSREACDAVALAQTGGRYYHRPAADVAAALAFVRAHGSLAHVR